MFFSTYKSTRVLGPEFLKPQVIAMRRYVEGYLAKSWTVGAFLPLDHRILIVWGCFVQYQGRYTSWKTNYENTERTIMKRWGGLDGVRALSADDQLRARAYSDWETWQSLLLPRHLISKPEGYDA
eukprot:PhF_6_TR4264/c0_g1_i1/m.5764